MILAIAQLPRLRADFLYSSDGRRLKKLLSISGIRAWRICPKRYEFWELRRYAEQTPSGSKKHLGMVVHEIVGSTAEQTTGKKLSTAPASKKISASQMTEVSAVAGDLLAGLESILRPRYYTDVAFERPISAFDKESGWLMLTKPDAVITRLNPKTGNRMPELVEIKSGSFNRDIAEEQLQFSGLVLTTRIDMSRLPLWILLAGRRPIQTVYSEPKGTLLLDEFRKTVMQIEESFLTGNFSMKPGWRCKSCPFRDVCPGSLAARAS